MLTCLPPSCSLSPSALQPPPSNTHTSASMAAKHIYQHGFLLLLFNFISTAALEKRFSDLKRCADEECSMLLVRGKALDDFRGPDCRFLSFKKSETIYVYYKLAGRRADMWAGSVGSNFGYFPKDLLAINHIYTEKEFEIPAEETDFVCFETGFDKFQTYDVDQLLGFLKEDSKDPSNVTSSRIPHTKAMEEEIPQGDTEIPDEKNTSSTDSKMETELRPAETQHTVVENNENEQITLQEPVVEEIIMEVNETKDDEPLQHEEDKEEENFQPEDSHQPEPQVTPSENAQIPNLETSFGSTLDAVVTEDVATSKTSPHEDEMQDQQVNERPLLTEDDTKSVEEQQDGKPEESMWSSLGDAVFSVVTGGEKPTHVGDESSEEEDDDEEDDEEAVPPPKTFDEIRADKQPIDIKFTQPLEPPKMISKREEEHKMDSKQEEEHEMISKQEEEHEMISKQEEEHKMISKQEEVDEMENVQEVDDTKLNDETEELIFESENEVVGPQEPEVEARLQSDDLPKEESMQQDEALQTQENTDFQGQRQQKQDSLSSDNVELNGDNSNVRLQEEQLEENATLAVETGSKLAIEEDLRDVDIAQQNQEILKKEQENFDSADQSDVLIVEEPTTYDIKVIEPDLKEEEELLYNKEESTNENTEVIEPTLKEEEELLEDEKESTNENIEVTEPALKEEEELLEDENALSSSQMTAVDKAESLESPNVPQISTPEPEDHKDRLSMPTDEPSDIHSIEKVPPESSSELELEPEPEYSSDVMRLSILREHLSEEKMLRCQKFLGLKNLFKLEAMFEDLQMELQVTRQSQTGSIQEIENSLERILETSENAILDEVEKILDSRESKYGNNQHVGSNIDEETEILDDFQELAFSLRHKYSTASDSTPLAEVTKDDEQDSDSNMNKAAVIPEETEGENSTEVDSNLTASHLEERPADTDSKTHQGIILDQVHVAAVPDVSVEDDAGHFNRNKDNQQSFSTGDDIAKVPQDTLEKPLDMWLGLEVDNEPSGSLESLDPPPDFHEDDMGLFSTALVYMECVASGIRNKMAEWTTVMISLLPDEWRPGETLWGCPWQAVVVTVLVGILTFAMFFWRTVLAVKKREYLVDHKKLNEQMELLKKEKVEALAKITELQNQAELLKENQKESAETATTALKKMQALETRVMQAENQNEEIVEQKNKYIQLLEEERICSQRNETRIEKLAKSNEKLQQSRKKIQETLAKTTVLLDEAKIREDARNVQQKSLEKDYTAIKEENKSLKTSIKSLEDRHKALSEEIKVYQKSQKELEDSLVLKDNNIEVLSDLLQKGVANGELSVDKTTAIQSRIKQMMDVSRVQTTLSVVEEERDRFMSKLLAEEKTRKALEEQHQDLEHSIATLKSEKSHVENQYKILQQKNEIIVEMYQQKESALQQRLTKEEMERRSKESMLTEVGGKATEAEEQVKVLRQRINEMEEQMKKTEEMYKEQIKEQENKTHSNWINARNAERALNQEKQEASKLREKLTVLTSQLNEKRAPLFRPNSGQFPGARQGDSYGPSPVSGGAPSPPIMIEGPRRPPSAPVGRKIDLYGPRPPSDPHGRYADNKHMSGMEMMGPRNSSPANMDAPGPGSFIASPIRDSPGPAVPGPPQGPGPHEPLLPPGPPGPPLRLPPPGAYRPMRPGPYPYPGPGLPPHGPPLQANGHPGVHMGGEFGPRPSNGHAFQPRPGPSPMDPRGPPPPHFRPPHPNFGPMPPPHIRGPMGPHPPFHPDMRYPGPRASPPMDLPPGVLPHGVPPPGPLPHGVPPPGPLPHGVPPPGPLPHGMPAHPGPLPHGAPAPPHSGPYGQPPPQSLQNSGAHSNPGVDSPQGAASSAGSEP